MIEQNDNLLNISLLCQTAEVSRSGYYQWQNNVDTRNEKEELDKKDFELILEAYKFRGYDKGSRGIHMRFLNQGIRMNRKKIHRLMNKYKLMCPIRKANPYRRMAKAMKTNNISENLVNREFQEHGPGMILLTDITYLFYNHGNKAYLSVIKDACTKQVMAYVVSESLAVDFVLETVNMLIQNHGISLSEETILHSDQRCHYTIISFRQLLKDKKLRQSMSRRGNCWDNAPQESFFGHMKDEIHLERCSSILDLRLVIDDYMDYYNNDRYQWGLAKLSPNQYSTYLKNGEYPIKI
ncbi:IS3 family transposase (plasmid) [Clostridium estertheticum]|uniref:IS3 family transposase n=1 Tax=Clostridium estertheticum TaxID=238834 RepID=UPI001C7E0820|nr:IS3 family transposase [Clostridium estertheticum]MBX4262931.1 IS3 family transposase [Clostridium estertheticum]WLC73099.1 IS3 family transposase [Clostridium estertheticum]